MYPQLDNETPPMVGALVSEILTTARVPTFDHAKDLFMMMGNAASSMRVRK